MQTSLLENLKSCAMQEVQNTSENVGFFEPEFLRSTGKHQNPLFSPHICLDDCIVTKIVRNLMLSGSSFHLLPNTQLQSLHFFFMVLVLHT